MITRAPFLLTLTALALTACAMALNAGDQGAAPRSLAGGAQAGPFACVLVAQARAGGGTRLEGRLTAREAVRVSYDLQVRGPGVAISQGGDLSVAAGQSAVLGEADLSTAASALDARLTVTANGRTVACPLQRS
jgi:hypothetical protein